MTAETATQSEQGVEVENYQPQYDAPEGAVRQMYYIGDQIVDPYDIVCSYDVNSDVTYNDWRKSDEVRALLGSQASLNSPGLTIAGGRNDPNEYGQNGPTRQAIVDSIFGWCSAKENTVSSYWESSSKYGNQHFTKSDGFANLNRLFQMDPDSVALLAGEALYALAHISIDAELSNDKDTANRAKKLLSALEQVGSKDNMRNLRDTLSASYVDNAESMLDEALSL